MTLNDQTFAECAAAFAERMASSSDNTREQIQNGFTIATCREPSEEEVQALVALTDEYQPDEDQAALKAIASVLLNLDEVLTK